jgi:hypothetical protein
MAWPPDVIPSELRRFGLPRLEVVCSGVHPGYIP